MNPFRFDYAVIGGDLRLFYLAEELAGQADVCHYGLCRPAGPSSNLAGRAKASPSPEACVSGARNVVCPIPMSRDGAHLNGSKKNISIAHLSPPLVRGQRFFAGCIPEEFRREALNKGVFAYDLMEDDALAWFNTVATAEGVICEAISESPVNLHQSRCAVLGYGKCGRSIASRLKGLFCHVSVVTASKEELAQAAASADAVLYLKDLPSFIKTFDFIFNTVPAMVLTSEILARANPSVTVLDIASAPGGTDFEAAKKLSINAKPCPGLPGTYAPLASARAILASIKKFERSSPCL